ncbi:hypothetical protein MNBD_GAMMA25-1318 [hydrothermal vent metagenome]|uniref:Organic solvent tolerance-like N-terminal domain-containing protein n=1 Tax=hydrothermal vent metagenome TaxID=652676 RepID=A0A3B1B169_9ZZZZ
MTYHILKLRQLLPLLLFAIISAKPVAALTADREQPIHINADRMVAEEASGYSHYLGNVHITQGSLVVDADEVYIYIVEGELDKLIILGEPAKLQQLPDNSTELVYSRAKRMEYFASTDRLFLMKNAEVWQGTNRFSGEHIEYDTRNSRVSANSQGQDSGRIRAVITPKKAVNKTKAVDTLPGKEEENNEAPDNDTQADTIP